MKIVRKSPISGNVNTMDIDVTGEQMLKYQAGMHIQNAMPNVSPAEREFILSGITPEEWEKHFPPEREFLIWHCINPKFTEEVFQLREVVGSVEATTINEAFFYSQNIDDSWLNSDIRSTSVGDVIQDREKFYLVKNIGFELLDAELTKNML